jgi:hypothetical protein
VLHVLNGDATATVFAEAGVAGERLVWRDILVEGPVTLPLSARAAHLAQALEIAADAYVQGVEAQTARLAAARDHDEIVLWFEQDLFCAVTLWSLLAWLVTHSPAARLSLVYPALDDGVKGLGATSPSRLAALFAGRLPVSESARALGARAWSAYAAPDPLACAQLAEQESSTLPFVSGAMRCHLGRFPSVATGLNEVEATTLAVLRDRPHRFGELFDAVSAHPSVRRHGMGDTQFLACVRGLGPLLSTAGGDVMESGLSLSHLGSAVAAGEVDWLTVHAIDTWLGGVHLRRGAPLWRWDGPRERIVAVAA